MRVYELANKLGCSSKDLLIRLRERGHSAGNHMSAVTDEQAAELEREIKRETAAPETESDVEQLEEGEQAVEEEETGTLVISGPVIVKDFARQLGLKPNQLIAELMGLNIFASINEKIDARVAQQLGERHGVAVELKKKKKPAPPPPPPKKEVVEESLPEPPVSEDAMPRPPIVTFLGHVDHGKTSLLDRIRDASVAPGEAGGITQHIGAYTVTIGDQSITFLDTPGHQAFTAMRARGANLTDIAVLIIAADDGVMPQTEEAIKHAKAAGVCIMAAINKVDLPGANVDRVKQQLQQAGLTPEDWGGDVVCCPVSAETGSGIEELLEMIALQAEILELKADFGGSARGYIIEARMEPGRGPTATLLVRSGTLKVGDAVVCGSCWGKIKGLLNDRGVKLRTAGPSSPVQCIGLNSVPEAGASFEVRKRDRDARALAEERKARERSEELAQPQRASLEEMLQQVSDDAPAELALVLKADVRGSLEAVEQSLLEIESDKVKLKFVLGGVGNVTGNDVLLASASEAIILGFNVGLENGVSGQARQEGVEIRLYSVVYELLDEVREAMTGLLEPVYRERVQGQAEVRQVFKIGRQGNIAGCMVTDGRAKSSSRVRLKRGGDVIYEGRVSSLKRYQNDAAEIREGQECGIGLERYRDIRVGDVLEFYDSEKIAQKL